MPKTDLVQGNFPKQTWLMETSLLLVLFSLLRSGIVGARGSGGRLGENFLLKIFPEDRGMAARPYVVLYTYVVLRTYS